MKGFILFVGIYAGVVLPIGGLIWLFVLAILHRRRMARIAQVCPYCDGSGYVATGGCHRWAECVCLQIQARGSAPRATFLRR